MLNGSVHVAVDAEGAVQRVRSGEPISSTSGRFALEGAAAARGATAALGEAARPRGHPVTRAGWWALGGAARAVYEVEHATEAPDGEWRSVVDAETGRVLFREDARLHAVATGRVYDLSPVQQAAGASCPRGAGGTPAACAATELVPFPNLVSDATLTGSQISVYDCRGGSYPTARGATAGCAQVEHPSAGPDGSTYDFAPDPTGTSTTDGFAAAMAYYQLDRHYTFLKGLDRALAALLLPVPAFVNAYSGGLPYDNAHYSPSLKGVVLGQGTSADFAYDASVLFHELTHAAVDMRGGFWSGLDSLGALEEPTAVNEGTADSLAVAHTGSSQIGPYVASSWLAQPYPRDVDGGSTCQGGGVPDAWPAGVAPRPAYASPPTCALGSGPSPAPAPDPAPAASTASPGIGLSGSGAQSSDPGGHGGCGHEGGSLALLALPALLARRRPFASP